jgi:outer membrane receptor for ferrienterochelin and colicin
MRLIIPKVPFIGAVFILLLSLSAYSQNADIKGKLVKVGTQDILLGATVSIPDRNLMTTVDSLGQFKINGIKPGKIKVVFSNVSFETKTYVIDLLPGQLYELNAEMTQKGAELGQIVVNARKKTNTVSAVVAEVKNSKEVVSGISKQQIAVSQDNNAAQVMQRVPGVTIMENRFIMIRGLNERYNNVLMNDVVAPSTEVDKRTFSFDLIPSNALDRMLVFKSASPDNPGDFAGGVIKLYTNYVVEKPFTEISLGFGFRQNTTFGDFYQSNGSPTDVFGFDNGYRSLPGNFPSTNRMQTISRTSLERERAGKMLVNNWDVNLSQSLPDAKLGFSIGRKFSIGKVKISNISTFDISQSFQFYKRDFFRYFEYDPTRPDIVDQRFAYQDKVYERQNRIAVMSNFGINFGKGNVIRFTNLFNQIGENETNIRQGEDFIQTLGWRRHYLMGYRSRSIYSGQLEGSHNIAKRDKLKWVLGGSLLYENEPDLRRFRTYAPGGNTQTPKDNFIMITPPSSNLFDASRYYGKLNEFSINQGATFIKVLGADEKKELKMGYYLDYRYRDFSSRYMSFLIPGGIGADRKSQLESLPLRSIFSSENISATNGFAVEEGTRSQDSYEASNLLTAGYVSVSLPFKKYTFSGGVRIENNIQTLSSATETRPVEVNNPILSILPSLNIVHAFSEKQQLRLGYGRTVNRPEFRELAPFLFYDYKLDAARVGNPNLKTATIDNIDLRYELYPRQGETVSLGAFYKYFSNPIENINIITTEQPQFTYANASFAYNYGAEVEFRKSLNQIFPTGFFNKLSFVFNGTYIFSEVDLGKQASAQKRVRPLQGQSPYIINAVANYMNTQRQLVVSLAYNIFGSRIYAVGDLNNPDIHELSRHSLDVTITKKFNKINVKAGIQDLLNFPFRFYQDTDRNGTPWDAIDRNIFSFRRGTLFNFSISYLFN